MNSIKSFPLFQSLSDQQITTYDRLCRWHDYSPGEMIIDHKDTSNDVRFISHGEVRVVVRMLGAALGDVVVLVPLAVGSERMLEDLALVAVLVGTDQGRARVPGRGIRRP